MSMVLSWLHRMHLPRAEVSDYCDGTSHGELMRSLAGTEYGGGSSIHPALYELHLRATKEL